VNPPYYIVDGVGIYTYGLVGLEGKVYRPSRHPKRHL